LERQKPYFNYGRTTLLLTKRFTALSLQSFEQW